MKHLTVIASALERLETVAKRFNEMNLKQKKAYIKKHPNSKYAAGHLAKEQEKRNYAKCSKLIREIDKHPSVKKHKDAFHRAKHGTPSKINHLNKWIDARKRHPKIDKLRKLYDLL